MHEAARLPAANAVSITYDDPALDWIGVISELPKLFRHVCI
jgi:hypothetical protein